MQRLTIGRLAELGGVNLEPAATMSARACCPNRRERKRVTGSSHPTRRNGCASSNGRRSWVFTRGDTDLLALRVEPGNCTDVRARAQAKIADIEEKMKSFGGDEKHAAGLGQPVRTKRFWRVRDSCQSGGFQDPLKYPVVGAPYAVEMWNRLPVATLPKELSQPLSQLRVECRDHRGRLNTTNQRVRRAQGQCHQAEFQPNSHRQRSAKPG